MWESGMALSNRGVAIHGLVTSIPMIGAGACIVFNSDQRESQCWIDALP